MLVTICFFAAFLYGWQTGKPKGVVQITLVICSFLRRDFPLLILFASSPLLMGTDFEMRRADKVNQVMMPFAPAKRSPITLKTLTTVYINNLHRNIAVLSLHFVQDTWKLPTSSRKVYLRDLSTVLKLEPVRQ